VGSKAITLNLGVVPAQATAKRNFTVTLTARQALAMRQVYEWMRATGGFYRRWDGQHVEVVTLGDAIRALCDKIEESAG